MDILNKILFLLKPVVIQENIYVFGDSHVGVFDYLNHKHPLSKYLFNVVRVDGATAQGIINPNSKTNALEVFSDAIHKIEKKETKLIFLVGEVDTGFVIWFRAQKYNESVESQLTRSINNYFDFLNKVYTWGYKNIYVMSAPLPTIKDYQDWGNVANLRKEVTSTQKERTDLTLQYNALLREHCDKYSITFIDLDTYLLDASSGLLKKKLYNKNINDHHLDNDAYGTLIYTQCINYFKKHSSISQQ